MDGFIYSGENAREISFPLGGIGTGSVGLAGNGQLIDIEIFGKPNKGSLAPLTHFAVKAEDGENAVDARLLMSDYLGCQVGCCEGSCTHVWSYAQSIPFLFPKLERGMRTLEYKYSMLENGGMAGPMPVKNL